ncbi:MAG TPA: SpoIIE family protein phosphatase [Terriglobales bacterium]|nr:SpoIIE family protein phosphatase [Terriglobales bacterium]
MRSLASIPRPVLLTTAILFAAATVFYSAAWMYYIRWQPPVEIGVELGPLQPKGYLQIARIIPNGPAAQVGLQAGDRVVEVNGEKLSGLSLPDAVARGKPGEVISLLIERPGTGLVRASLALIAYQQSTLYTSSQRLMNSILSLYPVLFLVVGLPVLFLRLENRNAWLLAIMFAGFIAAAPLAFLEGAISPPLRRFLFAYMVFFYGWLPAIFYCFFATFPASSPIDRRIPWLKTALVVGGGAVALACSVVVLAGGGMYSLLFAVLRPVPAKLVVIVTSIYSFGGFILGLVSLVWNDISAPTSDARRKTRVMVTGTVVGVAPILVIRFVGLSSPLRRPTNIPYWVLSFAIAALFLIPLSFAYAVVKHRVLEIPVLLRRSARYVLVQRGFVVLLFAVAAAVTALFTRFFSRFFQAESNAGMIASVALGVVMVWSFAPVIKRGTERIDKAFFRSTYDVRLILQDLAEKTRSVADRHELAALLQNQINGALHPKTFACFFRNEDGELTQESGIPDVSMTIPETHPIVQESANRGRSWDVLPSGPNGEDMGQLRNLAPECVVPILGRGGRLIGLLALGERLSEEPYSREDKRLLDSVASQAGMALENIHLAEEMAARLEAEHRAHQEMEFARQVQSRLFPQKTPPLETLEYSGVCIQARQVGGDYYDFLELRRGRLALVLADIAGKGISGALLMANLQANLRSQYAMALTDLAQLLVSANRLFYQNTGDSSYTTLFFADYDDHSRRLRYVNCGHLPPLVVRGRASHEPQVERLESTATVMGLFEQWECGIAEIDMHPGDVLVMYTDGVTEASNSADEEFGEQRLARVIAANRSLPVSDIQQHIVAAVQQFSGGEQADDITLVVARCRP